MSLVYITARVGKNYNSPDGTRPQSERELAALRGTALDADKFPILATHFWEGPLLVSGVLCCHDHSPLAGRFNTAPLVKFGEPANE